MRRRGDRAWGARYFRPSRLRVAHNGQVQCTWKFANPIRGRELFMRGTASAKAECARGTIVNRWRMRYCWKKNSQPRTSIRFPIDVAGGSAIFRLCSIHTNPERSIEEDAWQVQRVALGTYCSRQTPSISVWQSSTRNTKQNYTEFPPLVTSVPKTSSKK